MLGPLALLAVAGDIPPPAPEAIPAATKSEKAFVLGAAYQLDLSLGSHGGRSLQRLDRLDLTAEASFDQLGWAGGKAFVRFLGNSGAKPNERAGTLQGINNIEVPKSGLRLFEAWIQQDFDRASIRFGAYDLNSEFYATKSSAQLLAPAFGIGPELAMTGPRGPAIFPYSALALRAEAKIGQSGLMRAALVNADAGTLTDRGGLRLGLREGLLAITEAGREANGRRILAGLWAYSRAQPAADPASSDRHRAFGGYLLLEQEFGERLTGFLRSGLSDGRTTAFKASWQAGFQRKPAPLGSAASAVSLGLYQAFLSSGRRQAIASDGDRPARAETGIELTWKDRLLGPVTLQPSLQFVRNGGGIAASGGRWIGALRFGWEL